MREIALFVEDYAHQQIIGALVLRIAVECNSQFPQRALRLFIFITRHDLTQKQGGT